MCERNAFYIQASYLYLEANPLRDSEQSTRNITNYQLSLSQSSCATIDIHSVVNILSKLNIPSIAPYHVIPGFYCV